MATARLSLDNTQDLAQADCIEIYLSNDTSSSSQNLEVDDRYLKYGEIPSWLGAQRQYPTSGGLRLLAFDRPNYSVQGRTTDDTINSVLETFKLSPRTLESTDCDAGTFSKRFRLDSHGQLSGINIVLKSKEKSQAGDWTLSTHYDIASGVTTAVLFGQDFAAADKACGKPQSSRPREKWPELFRLLIAQKDKLRHPLALPMLLLREYTRRMQSYCERGTIATNFWGLMDEVGLPRGNKEVQGDLFWTKRLDVVKAYTKAGKEGREKARKIVGRLERHAMSILFAQRPLQWDIECSSFLLELAVDLKNFVPPDAVTRKADQSHPASWSRDSPWTHDVQAVILQQELIDDLSFNIEMCRSLSSRLFSLRDVIAVQVETANTLIGQLSHEFEVQIAKDNFRDATTIKAIAIITALFLPATFVATFMSMGIWNWRWSEEDPLNGEPGVVSSRWWVYVAISVPLTVLIMFVLPTWWLNEVWSREGVPEVFKRNEDGSPSSKKRWSRSFYRALRARGRKGDEQGEKGCKL